MPKYRVDKGPYDMPPKTIYFYEDDGNRIKRLRYVNPVRCSDCSKSEVRRVDGALKLVCPERAEPVDNDGFCEKGER